MTQYMLMFSLGPVQSFIAQARKTRDLWLGSYLLSTLMEAAMKDIQDFLVFPADPTIKDNIPDLPNKYVAIFDDADKASKAAKDSQEKIERCWESIYKDIWQRIVANHARFLSIDTHEIWKRQTTFENFFEVFWVVVKRDDGPEPYGKWLKKTQAALDARKRLRAFQLQDEPGEKSTISGEREALRAKGKLRSDVQSFWIEFAKNLSSNEISQDGSERLDAIDTIKRFAYHSQLVRDKHLRNGYPSTSSVATASFVERLLEKRNQLNKLQAWIDATANEHIDKTKNYVIPFLYHLPGSDQQKDEILTRDGDCYFAETFTPYRLKKDYRVQTDEEAEQIESHGRPAIQNLLKETSKAEIARPRSYYAMIQMDGDEMGVLLSGVNDQLEHQNISKALSDFARENVPKTVQDDYPGRLIYAGGDDVFALAPLARDYDRQTKPDGFLTVLDLVNELQQQYQKIVKDAVSDKGRQDNVTASTGIAIAHHFTSLSYVRRMAKNAEDIAKHFYGRNALVVTLLRRSGEQTQVGCKWEYTIQEDDQEKTIKPLTLFSDFFDLFKRDVLSPKLIYELLEETPAIVGISENSQEQLSIYARQESEIKRVLRRQRNEKKKDELPDKTIAELAYRIANLSRAMDDEKKPDLEKDKSPSTDLHSDKRRYGLVEVLGWLLVMDFLAREEHE